MLVEKMNDVEIIILPETAFEREYLARFKGKQLKAFIETGGIDPSDIIGLKIIINDKK